MSSTNPNVMYISVPVNPTSRMTSSSKSSGRVLTGLVCCVFKAMIIAYIIYNYRQPDRKSYRSSTTDRMKLDFETVIESKFSTPIPISNSTNSHVSSTDYFNETARFIRNNMDETVNPCENFFEFTCGSFIKNTQIPSGKHHESVLNNLQKKMDTTIAQLLSSPPSFATTEPMALRNARQLYKTCVDEGAIESDSWRVIFQLIQDKLGGWPLLSTTRWNKFFFDLSVTLLKLNQYNTFPFFRVATTLDYNSTTSLRYRIRIGPGHRLDSLDESSDENMFRTSSKRFIRDLMLMQTGYQSNTDSKYDFVSDLEKQLNQYLLTSHVEYSSSDIITTVKELTSTIGTNFDFSNYIRRLYRLGNVTLMDDDIVIVHKISNIREISSLLAKQKPETLQTYMIGHLILSQAFHMPAKIRTIFQKTIDTSNSEPRSIACAKYANRNMPYAVAKLYIDQYYDPSARQEVVEMVQNIRNTFIDMVNSSTWMDSVSKEKTIEKAQAIVLKVGYPDYLKGDNMAKLESMYVEYQFTFSHMRNVLLALEINSKKNLQRLREPIDRHEWTAHGPTSINAFYRPLFNDIIIPAAILQPPIFHKDVPKYLNYGIIGSIVGHELAHGFDELRRHIDADGNHYSLWSQETSDMFDRRSTCIVEQYNNYTVSQIGSSVDGENTREENIADNDGLKKAYYAYQKWTKSQKKVEKNLPGFGRYSAEQMFFIGFGQFWCAKATSLYSRVEVLYDEHAPSQFRSIGATSNFEEFDRAFGCKPGQGNSRVNKCGVW